MVPASTDSAGVTGSNAPQLVDAGHRDHDLVGRGHQATSQGEDSGVAVSLSAGNPSPCIHCRPVPATVVTSPSASRTPRSAWLTVSATTTS